jgi:hypothetical protein
VLQNLEIKYGWKELEMRKNFVQKIFLRFKLDLDLKFGELLLVEFQ